MSVDIMTVVNHERLTCKINTVTLKNCPEQNKFLKCKNKYFLMFLTFITVFIKQIGDEDTKSKSLTNIAAVL